jgi:F-type H+-transporting ATPase subunit c
MRNKVMLLLLAVLLLAANPILAQTPGGGSGTGAGELKFLGAMIGLGIAAGLCGIGQGRAVAGAAEAIARNPGAGAGIRFALILGLVFIESLTIYALFVVLTAGNFK